MDVGRDLSWSLGGVSANQVLGDERDAFRRADHVVERRVHEVEGPLECAPLEMAAPNLQCQPLRGFPGVGVEAGRARKPLGPHAGFSEVRDGTVGLKGHGVQGEGHVAIVCGSKEWGAHRKGLTNRIFFQGGQSWGFC